MRVTFYDTRLTGDGNVALVREKAVDCGAGKITTPEDAADMARLMLHMDELAEEHCYMMAFNTAGRILGLFFLSKGTVDACLLNPREIYIRALLAGASHIILLHNHPSGDVSPSRRDIKVTGAVREAGELIGGGVGGPHHHRAHGQQPLLFQLQGSRDAGCVGGKMKRIPDWELWFAESRGSLFFFLNRFGY